MLAAAGLSDLLSSSSSSELKAAFAGDKSLLGDPVYVRDLFTFAQDVASLVSRQLMDIEVIPPRLYPGRSDLTSYPWFLAYSSQVKQDACCLRIVQCSNNTCIESYCSTLDQLDRVQSHCHVDFTQTKEDNSSHCLSLISQKVGC